MKNTVLIYIGLFLFLFSPQFLFSQAPEGVNYQAVVRGPLGLPLSAQSVSVRFTIHQSTSTGAAVFQETHTTTTNQFGLINLKIGGVNATAFPLINWSTGTYFLQIEVNAGSGFDDLGTTQLLSVPYALYAETSGGGTPGLSSLLDTVAAGSSCPNGGYQVVMGLDANANMILDAVEVTSSFYVCNGAAGTSINWQGSFSTAPAGNANDAYYNSTDGNSYIFNGTTMAWDTLVAGGTSGGADADWMVTGNDMYSIPTGNVGIGTSNTISKLTVASADSVVASFVGTNPNVSAIVISNVNSNAALGTVYVTGSDSGIVALDPANNQMLMLNTTVGGNVLIDADSTVALTGDFVTFQANKTIYNYTDSIYNFSPSGAIIHVNQGLFLTDSLYVLGNNSGTANWVLANNGFGQAVWTDPSSLGGNSLWQSSAPDIYFGTGKVGIGLNSPNALLHIQDIGVSIGDGLLNIGDYSGTPILSVQDDGYVGIGTSSPSTTLDILSNNTTVINAVSTSGSGAIIDVDALNADQVGIRFSNGGTKQGGLMFDLTLGALHAYIYGSPVNEGIFLTKTNYSVGIGTSSPSQKLDVDNGGSIEVDGEYTYEMAKVHYQSYAPTTFRSIMPDQYSFGTNNAANWYTYFRSGGTAFGYSTAIVNLPDGAIVTNLAGWLYDNLSTNPIRLQLMRQALGSDVVTEMARIESASSTANTTVQYLTDTAISNSIIDNANYAYFLRFTGRQNSTESRLYGAKITYTVTKTD